jgi:Subtilase family
MARKTARQQQQQRRRDISSGSTGTDARFLRHIHIRGLGKAPSKFGGRGFSKTPDLAPIADRAAHAQLLTRELNAAVDKINDFMAEQEEIGIPASKRGMPMTVVGRPNVELQIGDGRPASTRGLKVLNVRRADAAAAEGSNSGPDQATFFVTKASVNALHRGLDAYGEWDRRDRSHSNEKKDRKKKPDYFRLFESGASIKETSLRDLWTDDVDAFPKDRKEWRWEVWTQSSLQEYFVDAAKKLGLRLYGGPSEFVETVVQSIVATSQDLQRLVRQSAAIVELRSASSFSSGFFNLDPKERAFAADEMARRIVRPADDAPRIVVLDTGVNRNNVLLRSTLPASDCRTVEIAWGTGDHSGHGTKMAGLAQFGDLEDVATRPGPIVLETALESVVVSAPEPGDDVPARYALQRAVRLVERKKARRVFCLAQTAPGEADNGRPSSTSAVLDQLAYNDGVATRLFCAAVGNVPHSVDEPYQLADYESRNVRFGIQSPAQAANALSVGAVSLKSEEGPGTVVAPPGDLMPSSRTACTWPLPRSNKPDIVMEGGNFLVDDDGVFCRASRRHFVLTTSRDAPARPLAMSGETSTATALAAGLAARLSARYPNYRMETIRGLMVHAAQWTPAMLDHLDRLESEGVKNAWDEIIARFGWGVPEQRRLFGSTANATTLILEDELRPYHRPTKNGKLQGVGLKEMKYFKLPWPTDALADLGSTDVRMRCTLSYFIEPDPQAVTRDKLDRYHSFRLKFDVKQYGETDANAQARVNALVDDPDPAENASNDGWMVAQRTQMGTLVQDEWRGPAYRLAERSGVSVLPIHGWWSDLTSVKNWQRSVRFSLIVSIAVPAETEVDLYREIASRAPADLLVEGPPARARALT